MLILEVCSSSNFRSVWHKLVQIWCRIKIKVNYVLLLSKSTSIKSRSVYRYFCRAKNITRRSSSRRECRKWRSCQDSLVLCHDPYLLANLFAEGSTKFKIIFCSQCLRRWQRHDQDQRCAVTTSVAVSPNDFLLSIYVLLLASYFRMFSFFLLCKLIQVSSHH